MKAQQAKRKTGGIITESDSWLGNATFSAHVCNCIGCCPRCGTCRTWPGHTPSYCDLLVKQEAERAALLESTRVHVSKEHPE